MKSLNYLFTVSELRFLRYHVCTIKVLINKRVCDHVTYSTSIGNSFQPCAHMYTITCGQPESFCLSEKYLRSLEAPLVQNSTWRGKSNYILAAWWPHTVSHDLYACFSGCIPRLSLVQHSLCGAHHMAVALDRMA